MSYTPVARKRVVRKTTNSGWEDSSEDNSGGKTKAGRKEIARKKAVKEKKQNPERWSLTRTLTTRSGPGLSASVYTHSLMRIKRECKQIDIDYF